MNEWHGGSKLSRVVEKHFRAGYLLAGGGVGLTLAADTINKTITPN